MGKFEIPLAEVKKCRYLNIFLFKVTFGYIM